MATVFLLTAFALPPGASASPGILMQVGLPGPGLGAAFDGTHVWYTLGFGGDTNLYRFNPATSLVDQTLDMVTLTGGRQIVPGGLAWDSTRDHLWVATFLDNDAPTLGGDGEIFEVDPVAEAILSSFPTEAITAGDGVFEGGVIDGLAHDPATDTLWFSEDQAVNIYQVETTGGLVGSFTLPFVPELWNPGLTFAGDRLWLAIRTGGFRGTLPGHVDLTLWRFTPTGVPLTSVTTNLEPTGPEDIAFDPVTFAPMCAVWLASHSIPLLTAVEVPCIPDPDTDEDGLLDDWETMGLDADGDGIADVDLPAMGADPNRKDVFVEIDWMEDTDHSHQPKADAVALVVQAFANAPVSNPNGVDGIALHVDVDNPVPEEEFLNFAGVATDEDGVPIPGVTVADFDTVKAANFDPARTFAFHYGLFIHRQHPDGTYSGVSEFPGNDMIVSFGEWNVGEGDIDGDGSSDEHVGSVIQQAGTILHELGHNLRICHGGPFDEPDFEQCVANFKPNYLSVMNFAFQVNGIQFITFEDGTPTMQTTVDYSALALPPLDEGALNERRGIQDGLFVTRYTCPGERIPDRTAVGNAAIDWDCDGKLRGRVEANINGLDPDTGEPVTEVLEGFNDWENLQFGFQETQNVQTGVHQWAGGVIQWAGGVVQWAGGVVEWVGRGMNFETAKEIKPISLVPIDVEPGSEVNPINLRSKGVTTVAILSTPDFDATTVIPESVVFAYSKEVRHPGGHLEDANGDGLLDLVLHFETRSLQLTEDDEVAILTGETADGQSIIGVDNVKVKG